MKHRALLNTIVERFVPVFALSRGSSELCFVSVFTVFCWLRATSDTNACARRKGSKINAFRLQKSSPGASGRAKIGLERPGSSSKTRKVARFFCCRRERASRCASRSEKVRAAERVRALMSECAGASSKNLDRDYWGRWRYFEVSVIFLIFWARGGT